MYPDLLRLPSRLALGLLVIAAVPAQLRAQLDEGPRLFTIQCAGCHGLHGEGGVGPTLAQPTLPRGRDLAAITRILASGLPGTEMPPARVNPEKLRVLAAYVKSLGARPPENVPGNPAHGGQLYASKGACVTCHTLRGEGGAIGPDLTEIGLKRSAAYLRRALVDPGADVPQSFSPFRAEVSLPENFVFVRATARDGRSAAGVRVNEDTFSIQLRDLSGRLRSFRKSELSGLHKDWGYSPMPSYAGVFTPAELDDLVAFLSSRRGLPPPPDPEKPVATKASLH